MGGVQVTNRRVEIHGLDGVASHRMDGVEHLAQFEQVPVVAAVAVPTVPAQAGHERGAGHAGVGDHVAADVEVAFRVRSVQGELGWCGGHQLLDQLGVEADPITVHGAADVSQLSPGGVVQEVDAGFGQHAQRGQVDGFQLVVGHAPEWFEPHPGLLPRRLFSNDVPNLGSIATPTPANLSHSAASPSGVSPSAKGMGSPSASRCNSSPS